MERLMSVATRLLYLLASTAAFGFVGYAGSQIRRGMELDGAARGILGIVYRLGNSVIALMGGNAAGIGLMAIALFCGIYAAIWIIREPTI